MGIKLLITAMLHAWRLMCPINGAISSKFPTSATSGDDEAAIKDSRQIITRTYERAFSCGSQKLKARENGLRRRSEAGVIKSVFRPKKFGGL